MNFLAVFRCAACGVAASWPHHEYKFAARQAANWLRGHHLTGCAAGRAHVEHRGVVTAHWTAPIPERDEQPGPR